MLSDIVDVMEQNKAEIGKEVRDALKEQVFIGICPPSCGGGYRYPPIEAG